MGVSLSLLIIKIGKYSRMRYSFSKKVRHRDHFTKRMAEAVENEKVELRSLVDGAYVQVG